MSTQDLVDYYAGLLIQQYVGQPKAYAHIQALVLPAIMPTVTIQEITFPLIPSSGTFVIAWEGLSAEAINWNDPAGVVQSKIRALAVSNQLSGGTAVSTGGNTIDGGDASGTGANTYDGGNALGSGFGESDITVTGSIAGGKLVVTFVGVGPIAPLMVLMSTSLLSSGVLVTPVIAEADLTLPLLLQDSFNLTGNTAVGAQLDILAKYVGVTRSGAGFTVALLTLDDTDFLTLILIGIKKNSLGSSLSEIVDFVQAFDSTMMTFDHANMRMSYLINSAIGHQDLIQLFVTEGLLPQPMGVAISVVYAPVIDQFFGMRTYLSAAPSFTNPLNTYSDYETTWPWLTYANAVNVAAV